MTRSQIPVLMGVVNTTPDSFSDGGRFFDVDKAVAHGRALAAAGAAVLDVGGESTRPGAAPVPEAEEIARTVPVVAALAAQADAVVSIDTRKPAVARAAFAVGARLWNDVSALTFADDSVDAAAALIAETGGDLVLMHAQGDPATMQDDPRYDDVVEEVYAFLAARLAACAAAGIDVARVIVDPGVGFGKTLAHNLALIANLARFRDLGARVLLGASRKRFVAALDADNAAAADAYVGRLGGSIAAALAGAGRGVDILRVHDVAETRQALLVAAAVNGALD